MGGSDDIAPLLLTSVLDEGEWLASPLCQMIPVEKAIGNHFIGGWVCSSFGLNIMEKRRISCFCVETNPDSSVVQICKLVAVSIELSRFLYFFTPV
jgi:hypothetical protein